MGAEIGGLRRAGDEAVNRFGHETSRVVSGEEPVKIRGANITLFHF
jgi:hypothetical protein